MQEEGNLLELQLEVVLVNQLYIVLHLLEDQQIVVLGVDDAGFELDQNEMHFLAILIVIFHEVLDVVTHIGKGNVSQEVVQILALSSVRPVLDLLDPGRAFVVLDVDEFGLIEFLLDILGQFTHTHPIHIGLLCEDSSLDVRIVADLLHSALIVKHLLARHFLSFDDHDLVLVVEEHEQVDIHHLDRPDDAEVVSRGKVVENVIAVFQDELQDRMGFLDQDILEIIGL